MRVADQGATRKSKGLFAALIASGSLVSIAQPAVAQQTALEAGSDEADAAAREIVVTASKREEKLADVGASITALGGDTLQELGAKSFADFAALAPGVSFLSTSPGRTQIAIRGLNVGNTQPSNTVAIYLNDTPITPSATTALGAEVNQDIDTFDMERIEILRGPQGTLYGASALGGVIKYVTAKPRYDDLEAAVSANIGFTEKGGTSYGLKGMVNVPLADWAAFRLVGYGRRDAGFIDNVVRNQKNVNDAEQSGGRAILALEPTPGLSITLMAAINDLKTGGESSVDLTAGTTSHAFGDLTQRRFIPEYIDYHFNLYSGTISYDLGFATITSATSHTKSKLDRVLDANTFVATPTSPSSTDVFRRRGTLKSFIQELRLASPSADGQGLEWLIGGYYDKEDYSRFNDTINYDPATLAVNLVKGTSGTIADYKELAGFANATYYFSPQFDVAGGIRYSHNKQDGFGVSVGSATNGQTGKSSDSSWTWSATARFRPIDGLMVYGNVSTGYRAGGVNFVTITSSPLIPREFDPEKLTNFEAGLKYTSRDFDFNLSGFYIDWSSIQLPVVVNGLTFRGNNGKARSQGFEASGSWEIVPELSLGGSLAYTDAQIRSNEPSLGAAKGDRMAGAPRWSGSGNLSWNHDLADGFNVFSGALLRYIGSRTNSYAGSPNTPLVRIPAYATLDLRAGVGKDGKRLTLSVANLFDKRGYSDIYTFPRFSAGVTAGALRPGYDQGGIIRPRTISLTFDATF